MSALRVPEHTFVRHSQCVIFVFVYVWRSSIYYNIVYVFRFSIQFNLILFLFYITVLYV